MAGTDLYQLYRIASLYYQAGKTQAEISEQEKISRSQISRMLEKARAEGVVRIEVSMPQTAAPEAVTQFLKQQLHLDRLILAPVEAGWDKSHVTEAIAQTGAEWLPRLLRGARVIGMGWGRTIYRMTVALQRKPLSGEPVFVPLIGAFGSKEPALQINTIIDRASEQLEGDRFFANLPAFREKDVPLTSFETKRWNMLREYWEQTDTAVFGLGTRESSRDYYDEEVKSIRERTMKTDVVGDILSQFFFRDGSILEADEYINNIAFPVERLTLLPRTICMAGGPDKAEALIAAAKAGYYKILITDSLTAVAMYEYLRRPVTE